MQLFESIKKTTDKILNLFYSHVLRNPSGQDQMTDHFYPNAFWAFVLLSVPRIGIFLGMIPLVLSFYKELVEDGHYKDLFSKTDEGADGRVDLFFRSMGSVVPLIIFICVRCFLVTDET